MKTAKLTISVVLAAIEGSCAAYPLPQQTAGVTTSDIVANIRCQARRAVREAAAIQIERYGNTYVTRRYTGSDLARLLRTGSYNFEPPIETSDFIPENLRLAFAYYATTLVTYEFTLQMKEGNKQGASIDLLRRFSRRVDSIGVSITEDRSRDVSRIFTLHDTFNNLAQVVKADYCARSSGSDLIFPARGRLPVEDLVTTYIYLNEWGTLDDAAKPDLEGTKKGPATRQMADTIMFTTTIAGTNNPGIAYNPAGFGFLTSGLGFTNENSRSDMHKVIVTLTTTDVPDGKGDYKAVPSEKLRETGDNAVVSVRMKNFQDDISTIARSVSQGALSGF